MSTEFEAAPVDLDAILAALDTPFGVLPIETIEAARQHREAIAPRLIAQIERAASAAQRGEQVNTNGHFFALFLLTEFRAREALPTILRVFALPDGIPEKLFGDVVTSTLPNILRLLIAEGSYEPLLILLDDPAVNRWVRSSVGTALALMVVEGSHPRDEIVSLLRERLRRGIAAADEGIVTNLVCTLTDLYPEEARAEIKDAFAKGLVDEIAIMEDEIDSELQLGCEAVLTELRAWLKPLDDTVAELQQWATFREPIQPRQAPARPVKPKRDPVPRPVAPIAQVRRKETRVGRNDPCPCGSGKKFKKCCGAR